MFPRLRTISMELTTWHFQSYHKKLSLLGFYFLSNSSIQKLLSTFTFFWPYFLIMKIAHLKAFNFLVVCPYNHVKVNHQKLSFIIKIIHLRLSSCEGHPFQTFSWKIKENTFPTTPQLKSCQISLFSNSYCPSHPTNFHNLMFFFR